MTYLVSGESAVRAAMNHAHEQGEKARAEGKPATANPYATEVPQWDAAKGEFKKDGPTYCPNAEQRDAWNDGYGI